MLEKYKSTLLSREPAIQDLQTVNLSHTIHEYILTECNRTTTVVNSKNTLKLANKAQLKECNLHQPRVPHLTK